MNIKQIKAAVDAGQTVHWSNVGYIVKRDSLGEYLITFQPTGFCIGLTNRAGDKLNAFPKQFFIAGTVLA